LSSVVALVGKNGSGKSRALNFIESNIKSIITAENIIKSNVTNLPTNINQLLKKIEPFKELALKSIELQTLNTLKKEYPTEAKYKLEYQKLSIAVSELDNALKSNVSVNPSPQTRQQFIANQRNSQATQSLTPSQKSNQLIVELESLISDFHKSYVKRINYSQIRELQEAASDKDDEINSFEQLVESVTDESVYNELGSIYKSSLRFLKKLPHQLVSDWIDCLGDVNKFNSRKSYERFTALKEIFENIFGKTLKWEIKNVNRNVTDNGVQSLQAGIWKINGREFNYSEFSDGEKTLFGYVLMFFLMSQNKSIRLKDSIIIIDEPELHLHPDAEIDLINGIRGIIEDNGQLFIATHSLNILSHLNYEEVFMVKDGNINHPSNKIQREALSELMKIEERVLKLSDFLNSISEWSYVQFMTECFTNPEAIEVARENDPQIKSLKDIINSSQNDKQSLLLDFGAGKGRLYEQARQDARFREMVEYSALEPNIELHKDLKNIGIKSIFNSYGELKEKTFDFVVLCNVLHEIDISEWIPSFNKIIEALKDDGSLIIIEAKTLKKGEEIGVTGFLLLDESELRVLFDLDCNPDQLLNKNCNENISCILIQKSKLKPLTLNHLENAMKELENNTLNKIVSLRTSGENGFLSNKKGRESAFLSQLHINARLAQKQLKEQLT
jgi:predicted ATPase